MVFKKEVIFVLLAVIILVIFLSGCSKSSEDVEKQKGIDLEQADFIANKMLKSFNNGNYEDFSSSFSVDMRRAMSYAAFNDLRILVLNSSGAYVSKSEPNAASASGFVSYTYNCSFGKENVMFTISFKSGENKVDGVGFDSANIKAAMT